MKMPTKVKTGWDLEAENGLLHVIQGKKKRLPITCLYVEHS